MIQNGYGWPIERAMKASIETTKAAKEAGLYTVFFTIDATRTELNRFLDIVEQVATEGHMDALTIADTVGGTTPDAIGYVVQKVIERLKKPVEIHGHQDFGLGVANTIAALSAGASVAHTTDHRPRRTGGQRADGRRRARRCSVCTARTSVSTRRTSWTCRTS